jgi:hypothetical protein
LIVLCEGAKCIFGFPGKYTLESTNPFLNIFMATCPAVEFDTKTQ